MTWGQFADRQSGSISQPNSTWQHVGVLQLVVDQKITEFKSSRQFDAVAIDAALPLLAPEPLVKLRELARGVAVWQQWRVFHACASAAWQHEPAF